LGSKTAYVQGIFLINKKVNTRTSRFSFRGYLKTWHCGEEESDDEFCDRTTAPVPKWEVLAGNRAVWVQL
jgi:hypothetical protein